jgi:hypothetical protein
MKQIHKHSSNAMDYPLQRHELPSRSSFRRFSMFSTPYPSIPQVQALTVRAHRLRGAVVAGLIRDIARWISVAAR